MGEKYGERQKLIVALFLAWSTKLVQILLRSSNEIEGQKTLNANL